VRRQNPRELVAVARNKVHHHPDANYNHNVARFGKTLLECIERRHTGAQDWSRFLRGELVGDGKQAQVPRASIFSACPPSQVAPMTG
jgi:hypothetical protein